jgi:iron complex transport system substrate-binding protein
LEKYKRIISFLPSATEILFELGLGKSVFGVTHECTYPLQALKKPVVIKPAADFDRMSGAEIDEVIKDLSRRKQPIFKLDEILVRDIQPDLLISQTVCSVCAPFHNEIDQTLKVLGYNPPNLVINPKNLSDILKSIKILGNEVGNFENAVELFEKLVSRIQGIKTILKLTDQDQTMPSSPKVLCLDWMNPFYLAGHWIPDMVATAGGQPLSSGSGMDSTQITISDIEKLDPDIIIIAPCGFDLKRTQREYDQLDTSQLKSLKAYKENNIFLVDSKSYFSKPSPRIITGIEILCRILYPDLSKNIKLPDCSFSVPDK